MHAEDDHKPAGCTARFQGANQYYYLYLILFTYYLYVRIRPTTRPWTLTRCGGLMMIGR